METVEFEGYNQNSSKISFLQMLSLCFLIFPLVLFFGNYLFILLFSQIFPQKASSEIIYPNFTEYKQTAPLAVIDYHTSASTFHRIIFLYEKFWKDNVLLKSNVFKIRVVCSDLYTPNISELSSQINIQLVFVNCPDTISSLSCRVDDGFRSFLNSSLDERIGWFFRATDDSNIIFENLFYYINKLSEYYDPMKDLVIRAHANFEMKSNYYIHGGPGYLMSRAYVKYHFISNLTLSRLQFYSKYQQDDTAESIIVRKIFKKYKEWDEFYINGFKCENCDPSKIINNEIPKCPPDKRIGKFDKIISFHMFDMKNLQLWFSSFLKKIHNQSLMNDIRFYNDNVAQSLILCKSKFGKVEEYNVNRHTKINYTQLKNPLIDVSKLTPESLNSHLFEIK